MADFCLPHRLSAKDDSISHGGTLYKSICIGCWQSYWFVLSKRIPGFISSSYVDLIYNYLEWTFIGIQSIAMVAVNDHWSGAISCLINVSILTILFLLL